MLSINAPHDFAFYNAIFDTVSCLAMISLALFGVLARNWAIFGILGLLVRLKFFFVYPHWLSALDTTIFTGFIVLGAWLLLNEWARRYEASHPDVGKANKEGH